MNKMLKKKTDFITKIETTELVDSQIREALREQARSLEKHLTDIDKRLRTLERKK
tara:strand:+ start:804 stop:968 length:165 start_codon:yes stop_codon:yes gene_type:complete